MKGDKGRQMNPSTQRAVPGIQAGRQRETNDKGRQMNPSTQTGSSRLGDNGRQMKGDKGRQVNPGRQTNAFNQRAVPGIQAGRQRETNEGRHRETNEPVHPKSCARHPG